MPRTQREKDLAEVWRSTPRDYRGVGEDGVKRVLVLRAGGTCLVPLKDLTDEEIARKLGRKEGA